jgi:hypothetical protein
MAGLSRRFFNAGYTKPKYMLFLGDETLFAKAARSFERYFSTDDFLFIVRDIYETVHFLQNEALRIGIQNFQIHIVDGPTEGQAESVYLGIEKYTGIFPLFIFNIDTIRYNYTKPDFIDSCDGYLEVFKGGGDHWSFVEPDGMRGVKRTTEKERISDLCSNGLYYFRDNRTFISAFLEAKKKVKTEKGEYYIAPLYNYLINDGKKILYDLIDVASVDFCGVPDEYIELGKKFST